MFYIRVCKKYCSSSPTCKSWPYYCNKKVVSIPSFQCCINDVIGVKEKKFKISAENNITIIQNSEFSDNSNFDSSKLVATILDYCDRNDIILQLDELLVIEDYLCC